MAICISYGPIGVPALARAERSCPNKIASSRSKERILKGDRKRFIICLDFSPHLLFELPYSNSPTVIAETAISEGGI